MNNAVNNDLIATNVAPAGGKRRILIIKLGGLGQLVLSAGAMQAIRAHHPNDHLVLLTAEEYTDFARNIGVIDEVWLDKLHPFSDIPAMWKFRKWLISGKFWRVYDLDCTKRSAMYFRMMGIQKPEWSGDVGWCSHPFPNPYKTDKNMRFDTLPHLYDRYRLQLGMLGMNYFPEPNLNALAADVSRYALPERYALIAPAGLHASPQRRWAQGHFEDVCNWLQAQGIYPVLVGSGADKYLLSDMTRVCQARYIDVRNLCDQTNVMELASLARGATMAIGNDNGAMQVIALSGCPSLLIGHEHNLPQLSVKESPRVLLKMPSNLALMTIADIAEELAALQMLDKQRKNPKPATQVPEKTPPATPEPTGFAGVSFTPGV